jgi:mycothiol system anti-sigma-R factor
VDLSEVNCEEVLRDVEHYLHGELDAERSAVLAEHLAECTPCWDRAEFQRKLKGIVRAKCQSAAPEHLVVRIRQALHGEQRFEQP